MRGATDRVCVRVLVAVPLVVSLFSVSSAPGRAAGPITTPTSAIRFYQRSVNRGLCSQAYKLMGIGPGRPATRTFLKQCEATRHLAVTISDPGYRIKRLNAVYACRGVRLTAVPGYAHASSARLIIGSDFLSASTGWIAVSRSGAYVPNGSCAHDIGANGDTAQTVIDRTGDAGTHWRKLLSLTTAAGPLVWIRLFTGSDGLVGADMGSKGRAMLFRTPDGGTTWRGSPLPAGYFPDPPTITFPDLQHGWFYIGVGAAGSMAVTIFSTDDGGKRWTRVAGAYGTNCNTPQPCRTSLSSGIPFGGDKSFITFVNDRSGWLAIVSNAGGPTLLHSSDGGRTWHDQHIGLPPNVQPPTATRQVFPMGSFDRPHIFGRVGILPEIVGFYRPKPRANWSRLYLYRSTDAGASWHFYQRTPLPAPSAAQSTSGQGSLVAFPDTSHWIAVSGNSIWWTTNAGTSWSHAAMHVPAGLRIVSLTFADPSHGWGEAVPHGQSGGVLGGTAVLRTSDGGRDWLRVAVP